MELLATINVVDISGKDRKLPAADIRDTLQTQNGCDVLMRDGRVLHLITTADAVQAAIDAQWTAYLAALAQNPASYKVVTYAAGTAYALTATPAALDFGTTDPAIVVGQAGTYLLRGRVLLRYNAATFAANRTVTLKFRRTNNTAADLTNGSTTLTTEIVTTFTSTWVECQLPELVYVTTNTDDALTIFADVNTIPTAGSLEATEAHIIAHRIA